MKIRVVVAVIASVFSFALPTFAQDTVDPIIAQQIRALAANYDAAFNKHDVAAVGALYTQDAVYVAQHGTSHGRHAIEKAYANYFQHWHSINHVSTSIG